MFSLQKLALCKIPLYKYKKFRKNVYYLFKYDFYKDDCETCGDCSCFCLGSDIHDALRSEYSDTIWMLFNCASEVIVYSQTDIGKVYDYLFERGVFVRGCLEGFKWDGYGDNLLLDHYSCFQIRVNNDINCDILCDMYSKLLFKLRCSVCQFVNCKFYEIYANIALYLYNVRFLRNYSF